MSCQIRPPRSIGDNGYIIRISNDECRILFLSSRAATRDPIIAWSATVIVLEKHSFCKREGHPWFAIRRPRTTDSQGRPFGQVREACPSLLRSPSPARKLLVPRRDGNPAPRQPAAGGAGFSLRPGLRRSPSPLSSPAPGEVPDRPCGCWERNIKPLPSAGEDMVRGAPQAEYKKSSIGIEDFLFVRKAPGLGFEPR